MGSTKTAWAEDCGGAPVSCVAGSWRVVSSSQAGEQGVRYESEHMSVRYAEGVVSLDDARKAATTLEQIWKNHAVNLHFYGTTRSRFCTWHALQYLKSRYCLIAVNHFWAKALALGAPGYLDEDVTLSLARGRGWSQQDLNAFFAEWALHNAFWDYQDPEGSDWGAALRAGLIKDDGAWLRAGANGGRLTRVTRLLAGDDGERRFEVHAASAPQRWGYNLVPLTLAGDANQVTVTFGGFAAGADDGDNGWSWGLAAAAASGGPTRISPMVTGSAGSLTTGGHKPAPSCVHLMCGQRIFLRTLASGARPEKSL